jgi:hypothetical protein
MSLPSSYFDNYADPGVEDRSYSANWRRYGFQLFDKYMSELEDKGIALPKTALDIGAANGAAIEEMQRLGIKARGIEASKYIYDTAKPETKKLIAFGDATELIKHVPANMYEAIYETAAQYIPKDKLKQYLSDLYHAVRRDLIIVLHTREHDPEPHDGQVNFLTNAAWRSLLTEAGFIEAGSADDPPYWFTKSATDLQATASTGSLRVAILGLDEALEVVETSTLSLKQHVAESDREFTRSLGSQLVRLSTSLKQLKQLARQLVSSSKLAPLVKNAADNVFELAEAADKTAAQIKTELSWLTDIRSALTLAREAVTKITSTI